MNVLIVTFEYVPFAGGIARYTFEVAKGLFRLGCTIRVLAPQYPGSTKIDRQCDFRTVRMKVTHGTKELTRFLPGLKYVRDHIKAFKPDAVLLTSDLAHGIGAWQCIRSRIPFCPVVHGSEIVKHFPHSGMKRRVQARWLKFSYDRANTVICVSEYVRNLMITAGFDGQKLQVIHNGIDEQLLTTPRNDNKIRALRERHNLQDRKVIMTMARVVQRKGQDQMIQALPKILNREPKACYMIVGAGSDASYFKRLAQETGVANNVIFTGEIPESEKIHYLDICDVFVLPSRGDGHRVEGLGISLLEAAARAKALIGTDHGGIKEIIKNAETGFLIPAHSREQLANRVIELLADPGLAQQLGAGAKRKISGAFTTVAMARKTKALLEAIGDSPDPIAHPLSTTQYQ